MKRIRHRFREENEKVLYSDKSRIRIWTRPDCEGYRMIDVGTWISFGTIIERPDFILEVQLEDFNGILKELEGKKYKVVRRWFLRYIRKNFTFSGHNISEMQFPGSPYLDWKKVQEFDKENELKK